MPKARKKKAAKKKKVAKRKMAVKRVKKVRCMGKTKDGKRCKRKVVAPAKLCHLHKKK